MINALLIGSDRNIFQELENVFIKNGVNISWSESGAQALEIISAHNFQIAITDEHLSDMTGIQLIRKLIESNPMINCAAISTLNRDKYHDQSEGLGLIMQLPARPGKEDGEELFRQLEKILNLTK